MANLIFTPHNQKAKYEVRSPINVHKDEDGHYNVDFQTPVHKVDDNKEVEIRSPFVTDDSEDGDNIEIRSPFETKDSDEDNKASIKFKR